MPLLGHVWPEDLRSVESEYDERSTGSPDGRVTYSLRAGRYLRAHPQDGRRDPEQRSCGDNTVRAASWRFRIHTW